MSIYRNSVWELGLLFPVIYFCAVEHICIYCVYRAASLGTLPPSHAQQQFAHHVPVSSVAWAAGFGSWQQASGAQNCLLGSLAKRRNLPLTISPSSCLSHHVCICSCAYNETSQPLLEVWTIQESFLCKWYLDHLALAFLPGSCQTSLSQKAVLYLLRLLISVFWISFFLISDFWPLCLHHLPIPRQCQHLT